MSLAHCYINTSNVAPASPIGTLCGACRDGKGVSVLLNKCVTCNNALGILILLLSEFCSQMCPYDISHY